MSGILDNLPVTTDPVWPWSLPKVGWPALALTGGLLLAAAAWSYFRVPGARVRRIGVVLFLRVLALLLIFLALSGASCVRREELRVPSIVLVGIDASASMAVVKDELGRVALGLPQEGAGRLPADPEEVARTPTFRWCSSASATRLPSSTRTTPATPTASVPTSPAFALSLREVSGERYPRACVLLSDRRQRGQQSFARDLAAQWRNLPCPIYTFSFGDKATTSADRDIILTNITTEPSNVAVKGKLTVRGTVDALGYSNQAVTVKVFINDKEVASERDHLRLRKGNQVQVTCDVRPSRASIR